MVSLKAAITKSVLAVAPLVAVIALDPLGASAGVVGAAPASGMVATVPASGLADGQIFTIGDGAGALTTFEFDTNLSITPGHAQIALGPEDTAAQVKTKIVTAVNSSALAVTAANGGYGLVLLDNDNTGSAGNVPITETVADADFTVHGMTGGSDEEPQPPPTADFDGDGDTDVAVFRPSIGRWFIRGGASPTFGENGDIPVPADYDGDGDTDIAVFRPSIGRWFIRGGASPTFGENGDIPVPADYDGDGDTDIAVFRPSTGTWLVRQGISPTFGQTGDIPVPGDYDGDGDTDIAVFRPATGRWFVRQGVSPTFGENGDIPVPLPGAILQRFFGFAANNETDTAAEADACRLQFPMQMELNAGATSGQVFARLYEAGVTEPPGAPSGVTAQLGWGPDSTDPRTSSGWVWLPAADNAGYVSVDNDDEYLGSFTAPTVPGSYDYTFRFSLDGGATATYCDTDGAGSAPGLTFDPANLGQLTVTP
jgi:hypothetical protein